MNRRRFETRVREDAQTWRDRIIGKRIVTSNSHIAEYKGWMSDVINNWEPRVYLCQPPREGFDRDITYHSQPASPLLRLPAEIRSHILEYVLPPQMVSQKADAGGAEKRNALWMSTSAVIFCCKQLYAEGRALAVEKHAFEYEKFPRKTRLCAKVVDDSYVWDRLNVVFDQKTNVAKQVLYG